jgi:hypothetical protein
LTSEEKNPLGGGCDKIIQRYTRNNNNKKGWKNPQILIEFSSFLSFFLLNTYKIDIFLVYDCYWCCLIILHCLTVSSLLLGHKTQTF